MIRDSLESPDRLSVSLPRGCDPTGCGLNGPRTHKRHLVSLFLYPVFREPVREDFPSPFQVVSAFAPAASVASGRRFLLFASQRVNNFFRGLVFFWAFRARAPQGRPRTGFSAGSPVRTLPRWGMQFVG